MNTKPKGVIGQSGQRKGSTSMSKNISKSIVNGKNSNALIQANAGLDIFARLTQQKKDKVESKRKK